MRFAAGLFVLSLLPGAAWGAPASGKTYVVVVVKGGSATAGHVAEAREALRNGLAAAGARLLPDSTTVDLMRIADAAGGCDDGCEKKMRAEVPGSTLVFARLSANATHFALQAKGDGAAFSAAGPVARLGEAGRQLGNRIGSSNEGRIVVEGGARGAEFWIDGTRVTPGKGGAVPLAPGRHVVRMGDGLGERAMMRVEVPPGEIVTVTFPGDGDPSAPKVAVAPKNVPVPAKAATRAAAPRGTRLSAIGGMAVVSRTLALEGANGGGFDASFTGVGPAVAAEVEAGGVLAVIDAAWIDYVSKAKFEIENGGTSSVTGGATLRARGAAGWRFGRATDRPWIAPLVGVSFEQHAANDPSGPDGPLGVLVDHTRLGLDVEVRGSLPLAGGASVDAGLGVSPWSSWQEAPKSLGESPKTGLEPFWRVAANLTSARPWVLRAEYAGTMRAVKRSGDAASPVVPAISDAETRESLHALSLTLRRDF